MRHEKTIYSKILYALFIGLAAAWMLVVITKAVLFSLPIPKAFALAFFGAAIIAAVGLRLAYIIDARWFIADCNKKLPRQAAVCFDSSSKYQSSHREPYFATKVYR